MDICIDPNQLKDKKEFIETLAETGDIMMRKSKLMLMMTTVMFVKFVIILINSRIRRKILRHLQILIIF